MVLEKPFAGYDVIQKLQVQDRANDRGLHGNRLRPRRGRACSPAHAAGPAQPPWLTARATALDASVAYEMRWPADSAGCQGIDVGCRTPASCQGMVTTLCKFTPAAQWAYLFVVVHGINGVRRRTPAGWPGIATTLQIQAGLRLVNGHTCLWLRFHQTHTLRAWQDVCFLCTMPGAPAHGTMDSQNKRFACSGQALRAGGPLRAQFRKHTVLQDSSTAASVKTVSPVNRWNHFAPHASHRWPRPCWFL